MDFKDMKRKHRDRPKEEYEKVPIPPEDLSKHAYVKVPWRINKYPRGFFGMYFQPSFIRLAARRYTGEVASLLLFFMGVVEYDNRIKYHTQEEIADILKMARPNISKAIKVLVKDDVIRKIGRDYYWNEEYIMKGVMKYRIRRAPKVDMRVDEPPEAPPE